MLSPPMKKIEPVYNPTKWEQFRLRTMILASVFVMFLFLREVYSAKAEFAILYYMLIITISYSCLRLLYEWVHYFYITVPPDVKSTKIYSVDIFTTFCKDEPYSMIEETLAAIVKISYPHKSYLCDESNDPYLKTVCNNLGVIHVTRIEKNDAKAGNINNALRISSGELCVIIDPDHVPQPDFLDPIVGHFDNKDIGFVQIVQAYKNYGDSLVAKGAAQQTFQFYGPIMMTMNSYGTVLAIGANCTFRRKALESIGGHASGLAEDMNTAMHLHAHGWKSIYVPRVLARGLVPSTLSAYYAQQLKWSRGVFELLVTSYPKLFSGFSWRQKLHYATIPLYYLSGIIFFINFSIPVFSLLFNTSPINIDFLRFMVFAGPLALLSNLIRHFVQRWVMEEEERGFHVVGGLLMIGTWWVFLTGFFYTILGKKVPYIPTPKNNSEDNNWHINIPNILVIVISVFAIAYGLYNDFNPFNLIMSGFAVLNCFILSVSIIAGWQGYFRSLKKKSFILDVSMYQISIFKKKFWLLRRFIYKQVRQTALLITVATTFFMIYWSMKDKFLTEKAHPIHYNKNILISGIFSPVNNSGLSSVKMIADIESRNKINFGIISLYLSWGDAPKCAFPKKILDTIYHKNAVPMITWEPWQSLFEQSKMLEPNEIEEHIFKRIVAHRYDSYLEKFSQEVKDLNKPIFIRFAHETDNPQYPWSGRGKNTPDDFKAAWRYIYEFFKERNVNNVIWVWNPWKPQAVESYFPGNKFVDWIGITNLNYGNENTKAYTMEALYEPYHRQKILRSGLPVMLAEMGSLQSIKNQSEWFKNASETISSRFPEIRAYILFNSGFDYNLPNGQTGETLNWRIDDYSALQKMFFPVPKRNAWLQTAHQFKPEQQTAIVTQQPSFLNNIKGVNYKKGQNWSTNGNVLKRKDIDADMAEIKSMGFNTIKIYGFSIYDQHILKAANVQGLKVCFSFWLPDHVSFLSDSTAMRGYAKKIIKKMEQLGKEENIIMWNIANNPMSAYRYKNFKPDLFTEQQAYFTWLNKLINNINQIDGKRPVSVDIYADDYLNEDHHLLKNSVPAIDCIGLVQNSNQPLQTSLDKTFISRVNVPAYLKQKNGEKGVFIADWQDEQTINYVSLDGIKDSYGKTKIESYGLSSKWLHKTKPEDMPAFKILLPSKTIWPGTQAKYNAVLFHNKQWILADEKSSFKFRWELIKQDQYKNSIQITTVGNGSSVVLTIPENPSRYKIRLSIVRDSVVKIVQSKLNIPLLK